MKSVPEGHKRRQSSSGLNAEQQHAFETLRSLGKRFRIFTDECNDPYVPCARGVQVFVWGKERIGAYILTRRPTQTVNAIAANGCPSVRKEQEGDFELIVSVHLSEGRALVEHLGARYVPVLSEGRKEQVAKQGRTALQNLRSAT